MTNFDAATFYPKRFSEQSKELANILIQSFEGLSPNDRTILSNNTFMVANQVREKFGSEVEEKMKKFTNEDWRCAWLLFGDHFSDY